MPCPISSDEVQAVLAVARAAAAEAGAAAAALQRNVRVQAKPDGSPVTAGDLEAERIVRTRIAAAFPADAILSEETADGAARLSNRRLWIIDPIDGTRSYAAGGGEWCVQVAVAVDGGLVAGALDMPSRGLSLAAGLGLGGHLRDPAGERPLAPADGVRDVLAGGTSERNRAQLQRVLDVLSEFTYLPAQSVGVKAIQILLGEADAFVHARRIAEWDAAAPAAVLMHSGARATDLAGGELRFNSPEGRVPGMVFSRRDDHLELCRRLAAAGVACL